MGAEFLLMLSQKKAEEVAKALDFSVENKGIKLLTAIAQDRLSNEVLMTAFVNRDALIKALTTGFAHYYSRSREEVWFKGETSGNIQEIVTIKVDCDADSIIYVIRQMGKDENGSEFCLRCYSYDPKCNHVGSKICISEGGVACHTEKRTCYFRRITEEGELIDEDNG